MDVSDEMKLYNYMHIINAESRYNSDDESGCKNIAELIHNNYDKMTDEEMKIFLSKCMSKRKIRRELLKYELCN